MGKQARQRIVRMGLEAVRRGPRNLLFRALDRPLRPRWLWFEVTDRCNSHCTHCGIWRQTPTTDPLTLDELTRVLSDPLFRDVQYVINSGGEPSLRSDLGDIIRVEREILPRARIQVSTNGLLPDRILDVVASALTNGAAVDVGVSLDGIGEQHDAIRGVEGNFERADYLLCELARLREIYGNRLRPTIGFVLSDLTLAHLEGVQAYARRLRIHLVVQLYRQSAFLENASLAGSTRTIVDAVESLSCSVSREMWLKWLNGESIRFSCFALYTFCVLKCDGSIGPCLDLWDTDIGNVRDASPRAIWHSPEAREARGVVRDCQGCLNSWGVGWSYSSSFYPYVSFYLRHPRALLKKLF